MPSSCSKLMCSVSASCMSLSTSARVPPTAKQPGTSGEEAPQLVGPCSRSTRQPLIVTVSVFTSGIVLDFLQSHLLPNARQRSRRHFRAGMSGNRCQARLDRVNKMPVVAFGASMHPSLGFNALDNISYLHAHSHGSLRPGNYCTTTSRPGTAQRPRRGASPPAVRLPLSRQHRTKLAGRIGQQDTNLLHFSP